MAAGLPIFHVKQRGNRNAIDWQSIGQKGGVILIDWDKPKLIHTIVIVIQDFYDDYTSLVTLTLLVVVENNSKFQRKFAVF